MNGLKKNILKKSRCVIFGAAKIQKYEQISDNMEVEIGRYLNNVSDGRLSFDGKMTVNAMMTETTEIESIGDSCYSIARAIQRKNNENIVFNEYILVVLIPYNSISFLACNSDNSDVESIPAEIYLSWNSSSSPVFLFLITVDTIFTYTLTNHIITVTFIMLYMVWNSDNPYDTDV